MIPYNSRICSYNLVLSKSKWELKLYRFLVPSSNSENFHEQYSQHVKVRDGFIHVICWEVVTFLLTRLRTDEKKIRLFKNAALSEFYLMAIRRASLNYWAETKICFHDFVWRRAWHCLGYYNPCKYIGAIPRDAKQMIFKSLLNNDAKDRPLDSAKKLT